MQGYKRPCRGVVGEEVGDGVPDGDDVVMKGSDDEVRGGEQSFSAFPHVRAKLSGASGGIPVEPPPCRNWRCVPLRLRQKSSTKQFTCEK